jgi:hypothetical protein
MHRSASWSFLLLFLPVACEAAVIRRDADVTIRGRTFVNKGLVGFGLIPHDARESTGDTIGSIGSAIAIKPGTWRSVKGGKFKGTLVVHPDRGYNV